MKDLTVDEQFNGVMSDLIAMMSSPKKVKADPFLLGDFKDHIGRNVEIQNNADGNTIDGKLLYAKLDNEANMLQEDDSTLTYIFRLEGHPESRIEANGIEYNQNHSKKYYFKIGNEIKWRIVFR